MGAALQTPGTTLGWYTVCKDALLKTPNAEALWEWH